jgi:hypothetical protein
MSGNQAAPTRFGGWRLVGLTALAVAGVVELELALGGRGEDGWRAVVRATAAISVGLFLVTYLASTLRRLYPAPWTGWLLCNRRYLGVSFAVSHFAHFGAIVALSRALNASPPIHLAILGGLGDLLLIGMVLTSFDRSVAWLGERRWDLLHRVGLHYIWVIFAFTYGGAATAGGRLFPVVAIVGLLGALGLRVVARVRQRSAALPAR